MTIEISDFGHAFLDALAVGESAGRYDVLYGGGRFASFDAFPQWAGKDNSHAAGRYQFEPRTWAWVASVLGLKSFTPAEQDQGAWWLAVTNYKSRTHRDLETDLRAGTYQFVAPALQPTWTSLSAATFPHRFEAAYDHLHAAPVASPPATRVSATAPGLFRRLLNRLGL